MQALTNSTWWPWVALPALFLAAWLCGLLLSRLTRSLLQRVVSRTSAAWDDALVAGLGGPLTLAWTLAIGYAGAAVARAAGRDRCPRSGVACTWCC